MDQLGAVGFTETTTGNRNDGVAHATSTVYYAEGKKARGPGSRQRARHQGRQAIDEDTQAAGGAAAVVVVLGADIEQ